MKIPATSNLQLTTCNLQLVTCHLSLVTCLLCLFLTACAPRPEDQIRDALIVLSDRYPAMTLQDVYKTCFQDYYGAEHAAPDSIAAAHYLEYELSTMEPADSLFMPLEEPTGWRHRYVRVSLQQVRSGAMTEKELLHAFLDAARNNQIPEPCTSHIDSGHSQTATCNPNHTPWYDEWLMIEHVALQVRPEWADSTLQADLREAAANNWAIHHSPAFREAYHPHYRIVRHHNAQ